MKQAAGTLLFRQSNQGLEVLLIHPSGAYNRSAPWGVPKGELDAGEEPESAARRETLEESGDEAGSLFSLGFIDYTKSRKRVHCYAGPAPVQSEPRCASWEVDCAEFVSITRARELIHRDQLPFLERLLKHLAVPPAT